MKSGHTFPEAEARTPSGDTVERRSPAELIRRYFVLLISLFTAALSVALVLRAEIGASPVSGMTYVLNLAFPAISIGTFTVLFNIVLILGQILLLRRRFQLIQLLQLPISFVVGAFTDLAVWLVSYIPVPNYPVRLLILAAGCLVAAFSVSISVQANVLMNSGEAFVKALADTIHVRFGTVKLSYDISLVILIALLGWLLLGRIAGIREGTVINALLVGNFVKLILPRLGRLERWMSGGRGAV